MKNIVKIVSISDTHNDGMSLDKVPRGDILIHAGDATGRGRVSEFKIFFREFAKHKLDSRYGKGFKHVVFVPGNHDWLAELNEEEFRKMAAEEGVIVLINESIELEGVKIWGSPVTPPFCNWAFNWDDKKRDDLWQTIPEDTDIVVTHGPPEGILDEVERWTGGVEHTGCKYLFDRLQIIEPKYHIFGHIHEGHGTVKVGKTTYVNASWMNEMYRPVNSPFTFGIEVEQT